MTDVVEGTALEVPSDETLKNFAQLNPEDQAKVRAQVEAMQSVTAEAALKSKGWDILREIYGTASKQLLTTSGFVVPVRQHMDEILAKLKDPVTFSTDFAQLQNGLAAHYRNIKKLWSYHSDKQGQPSVEEVPLVNELAGQWNTALHLYETEVTPLLTQLMSVVEAEYTSTLNLIIGDAEDATDRAE